MRRTLFASESVTKGHPDKVADQISDSVLDAILRDDPRGRVACETLVTTGLCLVSGEITTNCWVDIQDIARGVIKSIGYNDSALGFDWKTCSVLTAIGRQSPDIAMGVDVDGAGDQGLMFGYAVRETPELMPLPIMLAHKLCKQLEVIREDGYISYLRPDGKSQVVVEYDGKTAVRVHTVLVSTQHDDWAGQGQIRNDVIEKIIKKVIPANLLDDKTVYHVNPTGRFVIGGPHGDCGLTGRKIIVDTYGGRGRHGGGAFCVDGDTEFLTPTGWKPIRDYSKSDKVAQYHTDGSMSFTEPSAYINAPAEEMFRLENGWAIDQVLSPGHNVVYVTTKNNLAKKTFRELMYEHQQSDTGSHARFITSFTYGGGSGIDISDDGLRLQIAAMADGSYKTSNNCRFRLKKERKIARLREIIGRLGLSSYDRVLGDGYTYINVETPGPEKHFTPEYWNASKHQLEIIAEEVFRWDGDAKKKIYRTTCKEDADFIQYVLMSVYGNRVSILIDDRLGEDFGDGYTRKSILYEVCVCRTPLAGLRNRHTHKATITGFIPPDGRQYCFTVPTGMLVLRRNNRVFITGNSGKDPSKVDRSAAYAARWVAKNIVAAGLADECEVQISYAIGIAKPLSVLVNTFATGKMEDGKLEDLINEKFDLRPKAIIERLDLRKPIYAATAAGGHFGRDGFTWEKTDMVQSLA